MGGSVPGDTAPSCRDAGDEWARTCCGVSAPAVPASVLACREGGSKDLLKYVLRENPCKRLQQIFGCHEILNTKGKFQHLMSNTEEYRLQMDTFKC